MADSELLIAVTESDEINMVACQVAHTQFFKPQLKFLELGHALI